jgi:hypothetical protein
LLINQQRPTQRSQFYQVVPFAILPGQTRNFHTEDRTYLSQRNRRQQLLEPTPQDVRVRRRMAQIGIHNHDAFWKPPQLLCALLQFILSTSAFLVFLYLCQTGLTNVDISKALQMGSLGIAVKKPYMVVRQGRGDSLPGPGKYVETNASD